MYAGALQDLPFSMDLTRTASPLLARPFEFQMQQPGASMVLRQGNGSSAYMQTPVNLSMPAFSASLLPTASFQSPATRIAAQPEEWSHDDDPIQQFQQLREEYEVPTGQKASSGNRDAPSGRKSAEKAPTVKSTLQAGNGPKKKVPMQCQVLPFTSLCQALCNALCTSNHFLWAGFKIPKDCLTTNLSGAIMLLTAADMGDLA